MRCCAGLCERLDDAPARTAGVVARSSTFSRSGSQRRMKSSRVQSEVVDREAAGHRRCLRIARCTYSAMTWIWHYLLVVMQLRAARSPPWPKRRRDASGRMRIVIAVRNTARPLVEASAPCSCSHRAARARHALAASLDQPSLHVRVASTPRIARPASLRSEDRCRQTSGRQPAEQMLEQTPAAARRSSAVLGQLAPLTLSRTWTVSASTRATRRLPGIRLPRFGRPRRGRAGCATTLGQRLPRARVLQALRRARRCSTRIPRRPQVGRLLGELVGKGAPRSRQCCSRRFCDARSTPCVDNTVIAVSLLAMPSRSRSCSAPHASELETPRCPSARRC